jgi:hypothetical protein
VLFGPFDLQPKVRFTFGCKQTNEKEVAGYFRLFPAIPSTHLDRLFQSPRQLNYRETQYLV